MTVGTRVQHRRYPFLVGEIITLGPPYAVVKWQQHLYSCPEQVSDLRATPVQP
jgi:heat shock protein HspQ